jgi:hypothetical protein
MKRRKKSKPLTALEVKKIIDGMEANEQAHLFTLFLLDTTGAIGRRIGQIIASYQARLNHLEKLAGFPNGSLFLPPTYQRTDDKKRNGAANKDAVKQERYRKRQRIIKNRKRYDEHIALTKNYPTDADKVT